MSSMDGDVIPGLGENELLTPVPFDSVGSLGPATGDIRTASVRILR